MDNSDRSIEPQYAPVPRLYNCTLKIRRERFLLLDGAAKGRFLVRLGYRSKFVDDDLPAYSHAKDFVFGYELGADNRTTVNVHVVE